MYLYNAHIYTLDPEKPFADALVIHGDKILAVGMDREISNEFGENETRLDLRGKTILPGLIDAHIHLQNFALSLQRVNCETETYQDCLQAVKTRALHTQRGEWVLGHGWNQNLWPQGFGSAADLDLAAPYHPVYLTAKSLHAGWANSAALSQAGLSDSSPDPVGGRLGRNEQGHLNGILYEGAMRLVEDTIPAPDLDRVVSAIQKAQTLLWGMGITGVHDFDRRLCFQALQVLHERGALGLRTLKSIPLEDLQPALELGLRSGFGDDWLRIGPLKLFADGALGPQTAAMLQPFEASSENRGLLLMDSEEVLELGRKAAAGGFNLAVHAIGDRAVHEVLSGLERLRMLEPGFPEIAGRKLRHRIEHVQLIHPDDAARLAALGVVASMQPIHATSDMDIADRFWGARSETSYAWKLQLDQGARLAFGSDAPVESPNPFLGLHAAVTRRRANGDPNPNGWIPAQKINLTQALQAYTSGAAYAAGWEDRLGSLKTGYFADLIVLERDPYKIPPDELCTLAPDAVMLAGEWVLG
jgi:predicted amidohydrolase YtcJ